MNNPDETSTIKAQLNSEVAKLPSALQAGARHYLAPILEQGGAELESALAGDEIIATSVRVCASSEFVATNILRNPPLLIDLISSGDLQKPYQAADFTSLFDAALASVNDEASLATQLRRIRQREMVRIAWRDLAGWSDLHQTVSDLSLLAEFSIRSALRCLQGLLVDSYGTPVDVNGAEQQLVVLGMGKLGGGELNFSSDVDLIFAYPEEGETTGGKRSVSNEEYFNRLGRQLINVLDQRTADGFVFRIDMRLRPFGESGPLVMSFEALENYYQAHGREWERYAMIKARPVAGDEKASAELMKMLRPFIYRRYLDFGAFEAIRDMKQRIATEIKRKRLKGNIKLGEGGIREIEFVGQAFQLIRGGAEPELQQRQILKVLRLLEASAYLPGFVVAELTAAYVFLRNTEHRLQEYADQQTHLLPTDEIARERLAYAIGYASWPAFIVVLQRHMRLVHNHFEQVFEAPQTDKPQTSEAGLREVWQKTVDDSVAISILSKLGYTEAQVALSQIQAVRNAAVYRSLSVRGRERMDTLMPLLIGAVAQYSTAEIVLKRLLDLVEAVARRTSYLALLIENPMVLSQLVRLCSISAWISRQLMRQPVLLDELFDPRTLYTPPGRNELEQECQARLATVDVQDEERQLDVLRQFKNANVLRVAAADIAEAVPLMVVSDHLTDIAEVVLKRALELAWNTLIQRHGTPQHDGQPIESSHFAVIAYGKLGGIELGYGSDLDLVFIYDVDPNGMTDGAKAIANAVFYARLGQRMIHILTAITPAGVLYEVDMRLRPSGASGLLVSQLDSFRDYQHSKAWTWEHQALVRARAVAGDAQVIGHFNNIRHEILCKVRDPAEVQEQVRTMRERMRKELDKSGKGLFDLKQGAGGIADIEFMVQYAVLAHASRDADWATWTDNIRILDTMVAKSLVSADEGKQLADVYRAFRSRIHRLTLEEQPALVDEAQIAQQAAAVKQCWQRLMEQQPG